MKKFRKWLFKVLIGYDMVEYTDILRCASEVNQSSEEILKLTTEIHADNKAILNHNQKVLEANQRALDLSHKTIEDCRHVLLLCQEANKNENLD